MNEEQKDKGLKKAIKEENGFRLPSNFAYHTMRKVEEAIRLREKKSERRTLFATIAASIFLIGCCIPGFFATSFNTSLSVLSCVSWSVIKIPNVFLHLCPIMPFFKSHG